MTTPLNLDQIADAIVAALAAAVPTVKVDHFPDAPGRYPFASKTSELLVMYEGSEYSDPASISPISQSRGQTWSVTVVTRSLRGPGGAKALIEDVRQALTGWRTPYGGSAFIPTADKFLSEDNGTWQHVVMFKAEMPAVEKKAGLTGPTLTQITAEDA